MPYYTKSGDEGKTCILGKGRVGKDELVVEALGNFDELSCAIGVAASFTESLASRKTLENIQNDLHTVCAEISGLSSVNLPRIKLEHVRELEEAILMIEKSISPQESFLLPGGSAQASLIHLARAIARRSERSLVRLSRVSKIRSELLVYSNRLSTLLYVLARLQNKISKSEEIIPRYRYN